MTKTWIDHANTNLTTHSALELRAPRGTILLLTVLVGSWTGCADDGASRGPAPDTVSSLTAPAGASRGAGVTGGETSDEADVPSVSVYATEESDSKSSAAISERFECEKDAPDSDGDGLCDDAETYYKTEVWDPDSDGDALSDGLEVLGIAATGDPDMGGTEGLDLRALGADPRHRDVFVEIDYYPGQLMAAATLDMVVAAFAAAPVSNPDGKSGIHLHYRIDQQIATADINLDLGHDGISDNDVDQAAVWRDVDAIRDKYFGAPRSKVFHYALLANQLSSGTVSGMARDIPSQDFVVTLGGWGPVTPMTQAGTFMHELGHTLGLRHGGDDHVNSKPNYLSVMNYIYQTRGVIRQESSSWRSVLDYSRWVIAGLDEANLDEVHAMTSTLVSTPKSELLRYQVGICGALDRDGHCMYQVLRGTAGENLDFNRDGKISASVKADLNAGSSVTVYPKSQNDWEALDYHGGGYIGSPGTGDFIVYTLNDAAREPCPDHPAVWVE